mgnify:CR=1 FL=1
MIVKLRTQIDYISEFTGWSAWVFVSAGALKAQHVGYYENPCDAELAAIRHARNLSDAFKLVGLESEIGAIK